MDKTKEIEDLFTPLTSKEKFEIVDVQYIKENGSRIVRIFIDKDGGVTMGDCENMSRIFSNCLDGNDILKDSYILEVSSPGLNRVLKKEESFKRFKGSKIRIQTFKPINNQNNFLGILLDFNNSKIKIDDLTSGIIEIEFLDIKKANVETAI
ncbi:MAG: ribosome maturation factor RimP [Endomicrobium sp.]|nr:ribosome maturation factor RimP [Endomicrobium sp.]